MMPVVSVLAYLLLAPLVGALLDGLDRRVSARRCCSPFTT